MIAGTGIDMIEVARVEEKIAKGKGFREKVFAPQEIEFCESKKNKYQHYAARFAAKEAFLKATGQGLAAGTDLCHIEVMVDRAGKPGIELHGPFKALAVQHRWTRLHVSLSHLAPVAVAVVIIEQ